MYLSYPMSMASSRRTAAFNMSFANSVLEVHNPATAKHVEKFVSIHLISRTEPESTFSWTQMNRKSMVFITRRWNYVSALELAAAIFERSCSSWKTNLLACRETMSWTEPRLFFASWLAQVTLPVCRFDLIGFYRRVHSCCCCCSLNSREWELVSILAC